MVVQLEFIATSSIYCFEYVIDMWFYILSIEANVIRVFLLYRKPWCDIRVFILNSFRDFTMRQI